VRELLVIADDLSGAADCGIACARHGLSTLVVLGDTADEIDTDVLSVDCNTRHLDSAKAAAETARLVRKYIRDEGQLFFKKLDSTLRGNVAAELAAALEARRDVALNRERIVAVLAPAFPANGRTTSSGWQLVHGKPLEETELWQRESLPAQSHIPGILREVGLRPALIGLNSIRSGKEALQGAMKTLSADTDVLVCDAETDQDLSAIADASMVLGRSTIWAGSAGLAYHLPQAAGFAYGVGYPPVSFLDQPLASGPTLFVVGSLSSVSREQVKVLAASSDVLTFNIPPNTLLAGETSPDWREHELALKQAFDAGRDVAVVPGAEFCNRTMGQLLSAALARMVEPYADRIGGLVATGGESARAVLETWGVHRLRLVSELEAGLACSVTEGWSGLLPVLTKAGAFGTPQTLLNCCEFLHGLDRSSTANLYQRKEL
jgi:4-hydroxythreonine-4-phosphate dehydrogenase